MLQIRTHIFHITYFFVAPPPPPPLPTAADDTNEPRGKMNVKRINWEKIDAERVGNTIWEQVCFLNVKKNNLKIRF